MHAEKAAFEVQFGVVERATHRNTSWERRSSRLRPAVGGSVGGRYGVSLLNDSVRGTTVRGMLRLTLLRGREWPVP